MSAFLDASEFDAMRDAMALYDEQRDRVIKRSRDITKASKVAIYCLHRGEMDKANAQLELAQEAADELLPLIQAEPTLRYGSYAGGLEEYAEAAIFARFVQTGTILPLSELPRCDREEYLGGVLDFTGELNRYCVAKATARDVAAVTRCRDIVDALMGIFLKFDFRNGALRKKYDGLKYTLRKMENTLYELSLSSAAAKRSREEGDDEPED
jgi:predicted translin family RNA/ssDNA-binding protein